MNEYGESEPIDPTSPGEAAGTPAPTWQWTGTTPASLPASRPAASGSPVPAPPSGWVYGGYAAPLTPPLLEAPSAPARPRISRRTRGLGIAAAILLVGGAAGAGTALGFAHGHDGSSASGFVSGDSGLTNPLPTQPPSQPPSSEAPRTGGGGSDNGRTPHQRRGGKPSSYVPPGHATVDQQIGVVDINTNLKYQSAKAAGTGMILTSDGEVLTNNHVIAGATRIKVIVVSTGKHYTATVVGSDTVDDVAILQLDGASGLQTITPDTDGVNVGDPVTAVGNAMGAGGIPSAAEGNVIGLNRSITTQSEGSLEGERLTGMIQVDAQVIAGDSGGPLYDAQNEVIGMDTAASSSPMQSLGFAIPIDRALSIAQKIENGQAGGNITLGVPGFLGIQYRPDSAGSGGGAVVAGIVRKTPAADLGLAPGDTIVSLSGQAVTSGEQLKTLLSQHRGGDRVSLTWKDASGVSHTSSVTLIDGPAE
jgi:S1-C subfamily serine protease